MTEKQSQLDIQNSIFWDELCGTGLALSLGIQEASPENLKRFDQAYFEMYPYLKNYVLNEKLVGKKVLEIGLGYGTLGQYLMEQGCDYVGVDIARGPVEMIRYRSRLSEKSINQAVVASVLCLPFADADFDYVYTIGCLHHTGNLVLAVSEVHRMLKPGGKVIVMLYNRYSYKQLILKPILKLLPWRNRDRRYSNVNDRISSMYDKNMAGDLAPHTETVSYVGVKRLFAQFAKVKIDIQNFGAIGYNGRIILRREDMLNNLAHILGLDLYISAVK